MQTYDLCKKIILRKTYKSKEKMLSDLDIFLLNDRITQDNYNELVELLNA